MASQVRRLKFQDLEDLHDHLSRFQEDYLALHWEWVRWRRHPEKDFEEISGRRTIRIALLRDDIVELVENGDIRDRETQRRYKHLKSKLEGMISKTVALKVKLEGGRQIVYRDSPLWKLIAENKKMLPEEPSGVEGGIEEAGAESERAAQQEVTVDPTSSQITIPSIVTSQASDLDLLVEDYQRRESICGEPRETSKSSEVISRKTAPLEFKDNTGVLELDETKSSEVCTEFDNERKLALEKLLDAAIQATLESKLWESESAPIDATAALEEQLLVAQIVRESITAATGQDQDPKSLRKYDNDSSISPPKHSNAAKASMAHTASPSLWIQQFTSGDTLAGSITDKRRQWKEKITAEVTQIMQRNFKAPIYKELVRPSSPEITEKGIEEHKPSTQRGHERKLESAQTRIDRLLMLNRENPKSAPSASSSSSLKRRAYSAYDEDDDEELQETQHQKILQSKNYLSR